MACINLYVFLSICTVENSKLQIKKKLVHLYAEGKAVGVEGAECPNGKAYPEGLAVGV
jgi:hypothetical protein